MVHQEQIPEQMPALELERAKIGIWDRAKQIVGRGSLALSLSIGGGAVLSTAYALTNSVEAVADTQVEGPYNFNNSVIVDKAMEELGKSFPTGTSQPGECMVSAQRWAIAANGGKDFFKYNNRVVSVWSGSGGVEVDLNKLKPGDILQRASTGSDWDTNWSSVHTVVFRGYNNDGTIKIIDSNRNSDGTVRTSDSYKLTAPENWAWHAFRFGKTTPQGNSGTLDKKVTAISSQFTSSDGVQHVYWGTEDGVLRETWFRPGEVHTNTIRKFGTAITALSSQFTPNDGNQHIYTGTKEGKIYESYFGPNTGGYVTNEARNLGSFVTALSSQYTADGNQHVYYGTQNGRVGELWFNPRQGYNSWDAFQSNSTVRAMTSQITGDGLTHLYWGNDEGNLHETYFKPGTVVTNVMARFGRPILSASSQSTVDGNQHVYSGTNDGVVRETWFRYGGNTGYNSWQVAKFGGEIKAISSQVTPDGDQHVYSGLTDGYICENWFHPGTVMGRCFKPDQNSGAITAISSRYTTTDGAQHIYWGATDGSVRESWFKSSDNNATNTWQLPSSY